MSHYKIPWRSKVRKRCAPLLFVSECTGCIAAPVSIGETKTCNKSHLLNAERSVFLMRWHTHRPGALIWRGLRRAQYLEQGPFRDSWKRMSQWPQHQAELSLTMEIELSSHDIFDNILAKKKKSYRDVRFCSNLFNVFSCLITFSCQAFWMVLHVFLNKRFWK